ncbi:hypothetical protein ACFQZI_18750 [Mucilaginibacter lutimaris]|uniref:Uncharacterized protein n=1 Tax=Mucilaginibacter lutimaris TaxID=931629 RepID=A0ABW2ZKY1_9SPHI
MNQNPTKKLNSSLTRHVINLHQLGYCHDFMPADRHCILCLQSGECFKMHTVHICLINCVYDHLKHTYQYIHTIDTEVGSRGLLITNGIMLLRPFKECTNN